jgi:hypothetical protein
MPEGWEVVGAVGEGIPIATSSSGGEDPTARLGPTIEKLRSFFAQWCVNFICCCGDGEGDMVRGIGRWK